MNWVLVIGLLMNVIALPIVARRIVFLNRLITSGQPAPGRVEGVTGRLGTAAKRQVVEVFGQKKLLKWSLPGAAHFFVFWAFLILGTVYIEAYGALFDEDFHIPLIGEWSVLGFLQDSRKSEVVGSSGSQLCTHSQRALLLSFSCGSTLCRCISCCTRC